MFTKYLDDLKLKHFNFISKNENMLSKSFWLFFWKDVELIFEDKNIQNIYLDFNKMIASSFLFGHNLIDGNKRNFKFFSEYINKLVEYSDLI